MILHFLIALHFFSILFNVRGSMLIRLIYVNQMTNEWDRTGCDWRELTALNLLCIIRSCVEPLHYQLIFFNYGCVQVKHFSLRMASYVLSSASCASSEVIRATTGLQLLAVTFLDFFLVLIESLKECSFFFMLNIFIFLVFVIHKLAIFHVQVQGKVLHIFVHNPNYWQGLLLKICFKNLHS